MYLGNNQLDLNAYYLAQLRREAERERLVREAQANHRQNPVYAPVLAELGRHLSQLGQSLQEHYETRSDLAVEAES